jgi:predicted metal-dependent hydrolase
MSVNQPDQEQILVAGRPAGLRWRRNSRARRVALRISPLDGEIIITLPPRASRHAGLALLRAHENWVADRLAALPKPSQWRSGGTVPINNIPHRIIHDPLWRGTARIALRPEPSITLGGGAEFLTRRLRDALIARARAQFTAKATAKAILINRRVTGLRIKDTTSRWGSCAPDGTLMFSWRLIMAPDFVQDYVVGHEVAHLREMNHSPAFWSLAERLTPHREAATQWLAAHGPALLRIGA